MTASSLGAVCPGTNLGTPRSRVEGRCSWEGEREWSGMLVLWLNWALGIPRSFTEWPVPATETSGCGPLKVVPCLGRRLSFQPRETFSLWPTSGCAGFLRRVSGRTRERKISGVGSGGSSQPLPKMSGLQPCLWPGGPLPKGKALSSGLQILW